MLLRLKPSIQPFASTCVVVQHSPVVYEHSGHRADALGDKKYRDEKRKGEARAVSFGY